MRYCRPTLTTVAMFLTLSCAAPLAHSVKLADVIISVDSSVSMASEVGFVENELNQFVNTLVSIPGMDLHLVVIASSDLCVAPPLGAQGTCPGSDENLPTYRHVTSPSGAIGPLQQIASTYCEWAPSLRLGASRSLVVISDDDAALSAADFTSQLLALSQGFDDFSLHAIAASVDPSLFDFNACSNPNDPLPNPPWSSTFSSHEGVVYKELVNQTGGVFYDLCTQDFAPGFMQIASAIAAATPDTVSNPVKINELRTDQFGANKDEYFELTGAPGTSLDGLTYVVIGDDGVGASGTIEAAIPLTGVIPPNGLFVVAESGFTLLDPADPAQVQMVAPLAFENDDNVTHMLMSDFAAALGHDVDLADDGTAELLCGAPQDVVALVQQPNPPTVTEYHYGPPGECDGSNHCATLGPINDVVPTHVRRCPDGGGWLVGDSSVTDANFPDDSPGQPNQCPDASQPLWSLNAGDTGDQQVQAVAVDSGGNVLVVGGFAGLLQFGGDALTSQGLFDIFLTKLAPDGVPQGSVRFGDSAFQSATAVASDDLGNILLAGSFDGTINFGEPGGMTLTSLGEDIFLAKLTPAGAHLWSHRFGDIFAQAPTSVAVDRSGNVVLAGVFVNAVNFGGSPLVTFPSDRDIFLAKFDSAGAHDRSMGFGSDANDSATAVALDSEGNIFLTGRIEGPADFGGGLLSASDADIFLIKLDPNFGHLWSRSFEHPGLQEGLAIATDPSGNVVLTGSFEGSLDLGQGTHSSAGGSDIFLVKIDASGNTLWSHSFGDGDDDIPAGVAVGPAGSIALSGHFKGAINFGDGLRISNGEEDVFLARFSGAGDLLWSQSFGDGVSQQSRGLAMNDSADSILAGAFAGSIDFGGSPLVSMGDADVFVATLADSLATDLAVTKSNGVSSVVPGESVVYTITATNNGPGYVQSATLLDSPPPGLNCSWSSVATAGASGNSSGSGTLNDNLTLPVGSSLSYTVTCSVAGDLTGTLSNTVSITSTHPDSEPNNDSATDMDTLVPIADLALLVADSANPAIVGDLLTYSLTVTNVGPLASSGGQLSDSLPAGTTFQSSPDGCTESAGTVSCSLPALDVGATVVRRFEVVLETAAVPNITNAATVTGVEVDPNLSNNSATVQTRVFASADIFADGFE